MGLPQWVSCLAHLLKPVCPLGMLASFLLQTPLLSSREFACLVVREEGSWFSCHRWDSPWRSSKSNLSWRSKFTIFFLTFHFEKFLTYGKIVWSTCTFIYHLHSIINILYLLYFRSINPLHLFVWISK